MCVNVILSMPGYEQIAVLNILSQWDPVIELWLSDLHKRYI